jgi:hypothetical protein
MGYGAGPRKRQRDVNERQPEVETRPPLALRDRLVNREVHLPAFDRLPFNLVASLAEGRKSLVLRDIDELRVLDWIISQRGNPGGGASYRGAIHFVTATGKLAQLAGMVGVFEHSTDANDNVASKLWEWK